MSNHLLYLKDVWRGFKLFIASVVFLLFSFASDNTLSCLTSYHQKSMTKLGTVDFYAKIYVMNVGLQSARQKLRSYL